MGINELNELRKNAYLEAMARGGYGDSSRPISERTGGLLSNTIDSLQASLADFGKGLVSSVEGFSRSEGWDGISNTMHEAADSLNEIAERNANYKDWGDTPIYSKEYLTDPDGLASAVGNGIGSIVPDLAVAAGIAAASALTAAPTGGTSAALGATAVASRVASIGSKLSKGGKLASAIARGGGKVLGVGSKTAKFIGTSAILEDITNAGSVYRDNLDNGTGHEKAFSEMKGMMVDGLAPAIAEKSVETLMAKAPISKAFAMNGGKVAGKALLGTGKVMGSMASSGLMEGITEAWQQDEQDKHTFSKDKNGNLVRGGQDTDWYRPFGDNGWYGKNNHLNTAFREAVGAGAVLGGVAHLGNNALNRIKTKNTDDKVVSESLADALTEKINSEETAQPVTDSNVIITDENVTDADVAGVNDVTPTLKASDYYTTNNIISPVSGPTDVSIGKLDDAFNDTNNTQATTVAEPNATYDTGTIETSPSNSLDTNISDMEEWTSPIDNHAKYSPIHNNVFKDKEITNTERASVDKAVDQYINDQTVAHSNLTEVDIDKMPNNTFVDGVRDVVEPLVKGKLTNEDIRSLSAGIRNQVVHNVKETIKENERKGEVGKIYEMDRVRNNEILSEEDRAVLDNPQATKVQIKDIKKRAIKTAAEFDERTKKQKALDEYNQEKSNYINNDHANSPNAGLFNVQTEEGKNTAFALHKAMQLKKMHNQAVDEKGIGKKISSIKSLLHGLPEKLANTLDAFQKTVEINRQKMDGAISLKRIHSLSMLDTVRSQGLNNIIEKYTQASSNRQKKAIKKEFSDHIDALLNDIDHNGVSLSYLPSVIRTLESSKNNKAMDGYLTEVKSKILQKINEKAQLAIQNDQAHHTPVVNGWKELTSQHNSVQAETKHAKQRERENKVNSMKESLDDTKQDKPTVSNATKLIKSTIDFIRKVSEQRNTIGLDELYKHFNEDLGLSPQALTQAINHLVKEGVLKLKSTEKNPKGLDENGIPQYLIHKTNLAKYENRLKSIAEREARKNTKAKEKEKLQVIDARVSDKKGELNYTGNSDITFDKMPNVRDLPASAIAKVAKIEGLDKKQAAQIVRSLYGLLGKKLANKIIDLMSNDKNVHFTITNGLDFSPAFYSPTTEIKIPKESINKHPAIIVHEIMHFVTNIELEHTGNINLAQEVIQYGEENYGRTNETTNHRNSTDARVEREGNTNDSEQNNVANQASEREETTLTEDEGYSYSYDYETSDGDYQGEGNGLTNQEPRENNSSSGSIGRVQNEEGVNTTGNRTSSSSENLIEKLRDALYDENLTAKQKLEQAFAIIKELSDLGIKDDVIPSDVLSEIISYVSEVDPNSKVVAKTVELAENVHANDKEITQEKIKRETDEYLDKPNHNLLGGLLSWLKKQINIARGKQFDEGDITHLKAETDKGKIKHYASRKGVVKNDWLLEEVVGKEMTKRIVNLIRSQKSRQATIAHELVSHAANLYKLISKDTKEKMHTIIRQATERGREVYQPIVVTKLDSDGVEHNYMAIIGPDDVYVEGTEKQLKDKITALKKVGYTKFSLWENTMETGGAFKLIASKEDILGGKDFAKIMEYAREQSRKHLTEQFGEDAANAYIEYRHILDTVVSIKNDMYEKLGIDDKAKTLWGFQPMIHKQYGVYESKTVTDENGEKTEKMVCIASFSTEEEATSWAKEQNKPLSVGFRAEVFEDPTASRESYYTTMDKKTFEGIEVKELSDTEVERRFLAITNSLKNLRKFLEHCDGMSMEEVFDVLENKEELEELGINYSDLKAELAQEEILEKYLKTNKRLDIVKAKRLLVTATRSNIKDKHNMTRKTNLGGNPDIEQNLYTYLRQSARFISNFEFDTEFKRWFKEITGNDFDTQFSPHNSRVSDVEDLLYHMRGLVVGVPNSMDVKLDSFCRELPFIGNYMTYYLGPNWATKIMKMGLAATAVTKLGFFRPSAAIAQFGSLANVYTELGGKHLRAGLARARIAYDKLSPIEQALIDKSGIRHQYLGQENESLYGVMDTLSGKASEYGEKTMKLFFWGDMKAKQIALLAAWNNVKGRMEEEKANAIKANLKEWQRARYNKAKINELATKIAGEKLMDECIDMMYKTNHDFTDAISPQMFTAFGVIGKSMLQFQKYPFLQTHYIYSLFANRDNLSKKEQFKKISRFIVAYGLISGLMGLPFISMFGGDDELRKWLMKHAGTNKNSQEIAKFALYGLPSVAGINMSKSVGNADLLPKEPSDLAGPLFGTVSQMIDATQREGMAAKGNAMARAISPALGNVTDVFAGKPYDGKYGRHVSNRTYSSYERVMRGMGFTLMKDSLDSSLSYEMSKEDIEYNTKRTKLKRAAAAGDNVPQKLLDKYNITQKQIEEERERMKKSRVERIQSNIPKKPKNDYQKERAEKLERYKAYSY